MKIKTMYQGKIGNIKVEPVRLEFDEKVSTGVLSQLVEVLFNRNYIMWEEELEEIPEHLRKYFKRVCDDG